MNPGFNLLVMRMIVALLPAMAADSGREPAVGPTVQRPRVEARMLTDHVAVQPGSRITLGVELKIEPGWHVYWKSHGASAGLPTTVALSLPAGWTHGPILFPSPRSDTDEFGEKSFILDGTVTLLSEATAPRDARPGTSIEPRATVAWLVCKKECIKGEATVSLTLPIGPGGPAPAAANESTFRKARRALPISAKDARFVRIRSETGRLAVKAGDKFTAKLILDVEAGHHIQSATPISKELIATEVFLSPPPGLLVNAIRYPPGRKREDRVFGKLSEYAGTVEIPIEIEAEDPLPRESVAIEGVLRFQACNESGTCFPPQSVAFEMPLKAGPAARTGASGDGDMIASGGVTSAAAQDRPADSSGRTALDALQAWLADFGYVGYLVMAFLGGLAMNFMPCVLPVISIKVLSFVRQAHEHRWRVFQLGLAYSVGIILFYLVLAYVFFASGKGWGGQFQNPRIVIGMCGLVLAFSLSLFGVFTVFAPRVVNRLGEKAEGEGLMSAFSTGLLATLLGTACTAPLLSPAIGYATRLGPARGAWLFIAVGIGMAMPFVVLTAKPGWLRFLPKPGPWMRNFEAVMGFLLVATVIWLLNPLPAQIGDYGLRLTLIFLLAVGIASWVKGKIAFEMATGRKLLLYSLATSILVIGWLVPFHWLATIDDLRVNQLERRELIADGRMYRENSADGASSSVRRLDWSRGIPWQHYRRGDAMRDVRNGYTVFIDYTADWCANCKTNKKAAIERDEVVRLMRNLNVIPYEADYTNEVPEIKEDLARHGRAGVPMYLVIPARKWEQAIVLPEILTVGVVVDALRAAGPSRIRPAGSLSDASSATTITP